MQLRLAVLCVVLALAAGDSINAQEARRGLSLTVDKGRVTCAIRNYPIGHVLEALGARTDVLFIPADDISNERVSLDAVSVPLDQAVRQLLARYDTFLYYGANDDAAASLRAVWIYPKGAAAGLRPIPPESWAATADLRKGIEDPDPAVRERAYAALMSRPDTASRELVLNALRGASETDEGLRQRLLSAATQQGMEVPRDLLADIARADGSETLRLLALDALASQPSVTDLAAALANDDPSAIVRQRAQDILAEWAATAGRRKPPR